MDPRVGRCGPRPNLKGCPMRIPLLAAVPFCLCSTALMAQADPQCARRDQVVATLADRYGESRQAIGLAANATVMEIYASDSGSWTITITMPDGMVCLLASGGYFETLQQAPPAKGDPA